MQPVCEVCGSEIPLKRARDAFKRYCNRQCSGVANRREERICAQCGESFYPGDRFRKYCSYACMGKAQISTYEKQCERCGKSFVLHNKAYEARGKGRYCSPSCATRHYEVNEAYFAEINSSAKAYWLGFLLADGYNSDEEMVVNLHSKDVDHLISFKNDLKALHPVRVRANRPIASLRVSSKRLCADLSQLGCVKAKSLILEAPQGVPTIYYPHVVRGYFDGDGYISSPREVQNPRISIHCAGDGFRNWMLSVLDGAGVQGVHNPRYQEGRNIVISNRLGVMQFLSYIYTDADRFLLRKKLRAEEVERTHSLVLKRHRDDFATNTFI